MGGGGGYTVDPSQTQQLQSTVNARNKIGLGGDINFGPGAGSGLKFTPLIWGIIAGAALLGIWLWKR